MQARSRCYRGSLLTDSNYWRPIWERKSGEPVTHVSGRSSYDDRQIKALVADASSGLSSGPGDTLLDIGCAAGLMGEYMAPGFARYVGLDYISSTVARFRERCNLEVVCASATDLPFRDGAFTRTLMSSVLLCLSRHEAGHALKEMRRVTADGGRGFCSGNLDKSRIHGCPPSLREHYDSALWIAPDVFVEWCLCLGWKSARVVPANPILPQSAYMFDVILEA